MPYSGYDAPTEVAGTPRWAARMTKIVERPPPPAAVAAAAADAASLDKAHRRTKSRAQLARKEHYRNKAREASEARKTRKPREILGRDKGQTARASHPREYRIDWWRAGLRAIDPTYAPNYESQWITAWVTAAARRLGDHPHAAAAELRKAGGLTLVLARLLVREALYKFFKSHGSCRLECTVAIETGGYRRCCSFEVCDDHLLAEMWRLDLLAAMVASGGAEPVASALVEIARGYSNTNPVGNTCVVRMWRHLVCALRHLKLAGGSMNNGGERIQFMVDVFDYSEVTPQLAREADLLRAEIRLWRDAAATENGRAAQAGATGLAAKQAGRDTKLAKQAELTEQATWLGGGRPAYCGKAPFVSGIGSAPAGLSFRYRDVNAVTYLITTLYNSLVVPFSAHARMLYYRALDTVRVADNLDFGPLGEIARLRLSPDGILDPVRRLLATVRRRHIRMYDRRDIYAGHRASGVFPVDVTRAAAHSGIFGPAPLGGLTARERAAVHRLWRAVVALQEGRERIGSVHGRVPWI